MEERLYSCHVDKTNVTKQFQKIRRFRGEHEAGRNNEDIKGIYFDNTALDHFPRDLSKHFPNFTHLDISHCGINKITRRDFKGLGSLLDLEIYNCSLTSLPDDLFADLPNLHKVNFSNNKIEFASSNLFEPFAGRTDVEVDLRGNANIDAFYIPSQGGSLKSLSELMKIIDDKCKKPHDIDSVDSVTRELWNSGRFSDFTIITGQKEFKVHKNILGVRSSVLAKIIEDHKDASEIKINDFTPNSIEALLLFIYTDDIQIGDDNAIENFSIADKFKVNKMKSAYEEILYDQMDKNNAFEMFMLAHQHSADELKTEAFSLVAEMLQVDLPEEMMEEPEKLKKLVDAYREYQKLVNDFNLGRD